MSSTARSVGRRAEKVFRDTPIARDIVREGKNEPGKVFGRLAVGLATGGSSLASGEATRLNTALLGGGQSAQRLARNIGDPAGASASLAGSAFVDAPEIEANQKAAEEAQERENRRQALETLRSQREQEEAVETAGEDLQRRVRRQASRRRRGRSSTFLTGDIGTTRQRRSLIGF